MADTFEHEDRLVTLRSGFYADDAQLTKSLLEGNGVQVFMVGEGVSSMNEGYHAAIMVRASQWKQAEEILNKVALMPRSAVAARLDEDGEEHACSQCGSTRVHAFVGEVPTVIPGVRLSAMQGEGWFHCLQCNSHYKDKRSRFAGLPFGILWGGVVGLFFLCLYWFLEWLRWL